MFFYFESISKTIFKKHFKKATSTGPGTGYMLNKHLQDWHVNAV